MLFEQYGQGNLDLDEVFYIDYIKLYYEDTSLNEIDLYEYEKYYRLTQDWDLRASDIELLRDLVNTGDLPGALWKQGLFEGAGLR